MVSLLETATRLIVTGPEKVLQILKLDLRYRPKDYFRADAYQLFKMTGGERGWDGYRYPLALKTSTAGEILRGHKDAVLALCAQHAFPVDTRKLLPLPFADLTVDQVRDDLIQAPFVLDTAQKTAVVEWLKHGIGVAHIAVNGGKTAAFASAAALIKQQFPEARFLYFTFTERLVNQVFKSMSEFLPDWHITQYGGGAGKRDATGKDMVVATQAILHRHYRQLVKDRWFTTFMGLLLDESHHCSSPTAERVILTSSAFFRLGASDSTKEADPDRWRKILGLCGPVRCRVSSTELISQGRSAAPTLYLVDIPEWKHRFAGKDHEVKPRSAAWTLVDGAWVKALYLGPVYERDAQGNVKTKMRSELVGEAWIKQQVPIIVPSLHRVQVEGVERDVEARYTLLDRRYDRAIILFKERNDLIVQWARFYAQQGKPTLVVATRTPHVLILETLLRQALDPSQVQSLMGDASTACRNDVFDWLRKTPGAVLVTPLIKEGVSINELRAGIIADPVADPEVARQIIGRFMRKKDEGNTCEITWFVDSQHSRFLKNVREVIGGLSQIEGFTFHHPVSTPETIGQAQKHLGKSTSS